ncbi:hypothetical protein BS50DRAFT_297985 [Corynespora cassiicola Philippines]|uniref:Uncharacterized protein n=1 Tax=Corynespora cassiicola Philippines TaxID=1448308 RepID=A0A2T2NWT4_CORCC|nr:hypothetical protein BS50DRAFT_297985 [Corynespora cassiicola Philippines]
MARAMTLLGTGSVVVVGGCFGARLANFTMRPASSPARRGFNASLCLSCCFVSTSCAHPRNRRRKMGNERRRICTRELPAEHQHGRKGPLARDLRAFGKRYAKRSARMNDLRRPDVHIDVTRRWTLEERCGGMYPLLLATIPLIFSASASEPSWGSSWYFTL